MRRSRKNRAVFFLLVLPSFAQGVDYETAGGQLWRTRSRVTVAKEMKLEKPLVLVADEVVIDAPILTRTHALTIEARRLTFTDKGSIRVFDADAAAQSEVPPAPATPAAAGAVPAGVGADGAQGAAGYPGTDGFGAQGALPGEISIFAAQVEGKVRVEATGQRGGTGGQGGAGQNGGPGGKGRNANAKIIGSNTTAGPGGTGGKCGPGGKGGKGGQGGSVVPLAFLTSRVPEVAPEIATGPGRGGDGGAPGKAGAAGEGGVGGDGDKAAFTFVTSTEPNGPAGANGTCPVADLGKGEAGASGPNYYQQKEFWEKRLGRQEPVVIQQLAALESARVALVQQWFRMHWWRLFELLSRSSLNLLLSEKPKDADEALEKLLGGELSRANLAVVAERWRKAFLEPLKKRQDEVGARDVELKKTLEIVSDWGTSYTTLLEKGVKAGALDKYDVSKLEDVVLQVTSLRSRNAVRAVRACTDFVKAVLDRQDLVKGRTSYYDVPVCLNAREFLTKKGVHQPILFLGEVRVPADLKTYPELVVEIAPGPKTGRLWNRWFDWIFPTAWAADPPKSDLTGWTFPKDGVTLDNLESLLRNLADVR